jgi:hypothetical protein
MKRVALVVALLLLPLASCGWMQPRFGAVGAPYFVLMGDDGKVRGIYFAEKAGTGLYLMDALGLPRISMMVTGEQASLALLDRFGKPRLVLATIDEDGTTYAALLDKDGKIATMLGINRDESVAGIMHKEQIERDARSLVEKLKSSWLEAMREVDRQQR